MKHFLVMVALFVATTNSYAQNACVDFFVDPTYVDPLVLEEAAKAELRELDKKEMKEILQGVNQEQLMASAKELVEQMSSLENKIEFWGNQTGQYERSSLFSIRDRRKKFVFYFETSNELYEAVNIYREVFKSVEMSFIQLKRYYAMPKEQRDQYMSLEKLKEVETIFGVNYGDYMYVREYLENILAKVPTDAASPEGVLYSNAKYVLGRLGTPIIAERFEGLEVTKERPSRDQIEVLFRSTPGPLIAKLTKDLKTERWLAFRTFVTGAFQVKALQQLIYKVVPARFKEAVTAFIGVNYNSYVLKRYLSDIALIVGAKTPENQVIVFREIAAKHSAHEFYVTFARLVAYTDTWITVRKAIEEKKDEVVYGRIFEDMKKAEEDLKNYSLLPQFHKPSLIDHFTKWIVPMGVSAGTYFYADFATIQAGVASAYTSIASMLPF